MRAVQGTSVPGRAISAGGWRRHAKFDVLRGGAGIFAQRHAQLSRAILCRANCTQDLVAGGGRFERLSHPGTGGSGQHLRDEMRRFETSHIRVRQENRHIRQFRHRSVSGGAREPTDGEGQAASPGTTGQELPLIKSTYVSQERTMERLQPGNPSASALHGIQFGNVSERSMAWKRDSLRRGSKKGAVFTRTSHGSRSRIAVSSQWSARTLSPH